MQAVSECSTEKTIKESLRLSYSMTPGLRKDIRCLMIGLYDHTLFFACKSPEQTSVSELLTW